MKFKDVKVGDKIYKEKSVPYTWGTKATFWCKLPVERVTPTQIVVDGVIFYRKDGHEVGGYSKVLLEGDSRPWSDTPVSDETQQYVEMRTKIAIRNKLHKISEALFKMDKDQLASVDVALFNEALVSMEKLGKTYEESQSETDIE